MSKPPEDDAAWDQLIAGLVSGDQQVIADFYNQYGSTLRAVADKQIAAEMKRRVGASDVVQSAFRTFFRRAEAGKFQFQDSEKLMSSLDEEERQVLSLKIDDYTNEEIADSVGSSERTVRRIVKRLKTVLGEMYT